MTTHPLLEIDTWYLPTSYGDIRLLAKDDGRTLVELCKLTRAELTAVEALRKHSMGNLIRSAWATEATWEKLPKAFEVVHAGDFEVELAAPVHKVEAVLTKALRKNRKTVSVVTHKPGEYIEIVGRDDEESGSAPYRREAEPEHKPLKKREKSQPAKAVTVAAPVQGCPAPDFAAAQVRASEVLRSFLKPEQIADFEKHQQFVTIGAETGHRYVITSRHAVSKLTRFARTVYDLNESRPLCVHDWDIPPAEEMLTMHLLLSLPQWEPYIRGLQAPD